MITDSWFIKAYHAAQTAFEPEFIVHNEGFVHPYIMRLLQNIA